MSEGSREQPSSSSEMSKEASTRRASTTEAVEARPASSKPDTNAKAGQKKTLFRDKLPGALRGPLDALFPTSKRPSPVYGARRPAFLLEGSARSAWRARRNLARAMVALLAALILVLNPTTLNMLGQASFFGMIVATMLPPTFALQMLIMIAGLLGFGMCFGWAWGCAAMAAANQARSQALLQSQQQAVQASLAGSANPAADYQNALFHGEFLDWRSTVVFGFFMAFALFWLAIASAKKPKLFLSTIFASIVIDVMCSYGPLFPTPNYTLAKLFLLPTACFVAIALASTVLIFPETLNYRWTVDLVDKFLAPVLQRSHVHSKLLAAPAPEFHAITDRDVSHDVEQANPWQVFVPAMTATQEMMSAGLGALLAAMPMMELEISVGWLSSSDLKSLTDTIKELQARAVGLAVLHTTVETRHRRYEAYRKSAEGETARVQRARHRMLSAETNNGHDLRSLLPRFAHASESLRTSTDTALEHVMGWLIAQNDARWGVISRLPSRKRSDPTKFDLAAVAQELERELSTYRKEKRGDILAPFAGFFDKETGVLLEAFELRARGHVGEGEERLFAPGSLLTVLAASDNFVIFAEAVLALTRKVSTLQHKRTRSRLWLPTSLRSIGKLLQGGKRSSTALDDQDNPDEVEAVPEAVADDDESERTLAPESSAEKGEKDNEKGAEKRESERKGRRGKKGAETPHSIVMSRNPDALPPKNAWQRITFAIWRTLHFFISPEAIFGFKYVAASIVIWLPQVFPATAWLCYSEKSLWSLIMAQTALAVYAGAQMMSSIQKLFGIAVGLVYGMLIWYIGAANGPGSPYGIGAATVVLMTPVLAVRIFAPLASTQIAIQLAVTAILVVGYSWQDTHLPSPGNPGIGYSIAWRRALLVMIGVGVATVFMLLPPQSTRRLVRRTHATCIQELARVYTLVISAWLREERYDQVVAASGVAGAGPVPFAPAQQKRARERMLALRLKLNDNRIAVMQASYELSLRGDYPKGPHMLLVTTQFVLLQALSQLGQALVRLDSKWRTQLVHRTAFLNQPLIADVSSSMALISLALREGAPLPKATPGPLIDRLLYHDRRLRLMSEPGDGPVKHPLEDGGNVEIEGAQVGDFKLTRAVIEDERFGVYASALQALASILLAVDELERTTKQLVGQVDFPGYEELLKHTQ